MVVDTAVWRNTLGSGHADTVTSINNLRLLLKAKGATSLPLYVQLLRERR